MSYTISPHSPEKKKWQRDGIWWRHERRRREAGEMDKINNAPPLPQANILEALWRRKTGNRRALRYIMYGKKKRGRCVPSASAISAALPFLVQWRFFTWHACRHKHQPPGTSVLTMPRADGGDGRVNAVINERRTHSAWPLILQTPAVFTSPSSSRAAHAATQHFYAYRYLPRCVAYKDQTRVSNIRSAKATENEGERLAPGERAATTTPARRGKWRASITSAQHSTWLPSAGRRIGRERRWWWYAAPHEIVDDVKMKDRRSSYGLYYYAHHRRTTAPPTRADNLWKQAREEIYNLILCALASVSYLPCAQIKGRFDISLVRLACKYNLENLSAAHTA